jgi:class 3 adenylate cyclase
MPDPVVPLDHLKELLSEVDPDQLRRVMPLVGGVITMMFTDIVDSTRVKHEVGDPSYFAAFRALALDSGLRDSLSEYSSNQRNDPLRIR